MRLNVLFLDIGEEIIDNIDLRWIVKSKGHTSNPYTSHQSDNYFPVKTNSKLPDHYQESDIILADISEKEKYEAELDDIPEGVQSWFVNHSNGEVYPNLLEYALLARDVERILNNGGVLVLFAGSPRSQEFVLGERISSYRGISKEKTISPNNFALANNIVRIYSKKISGSSTFLSSDVKEIKNGTLRNLLENYKDRIHYNSKIRLQSIDVDYHVPLLVNKFDDLISSLIFPRKCSGSIIILPQIIYQKGDFITDLLEIVIPELITEIVDVGNLHEWTSESVYEIDKIKQIRNKKSEIREEYNNKISKLDSEIESLRNKYSFIYDILLESGEDLVKAVIECLKFIGIESVVDVDEKLDEGEMKKEDIDIFLDDRSLIVEVKGVSNKPTDEDALTVRKYIAPRIRDWEDPNVTGLSILNHQRSLRPLDRDRFPFRETVVTSAKSEGIGLLTTWELHRLARGVIEYGWETEDILPLLSQDGPIRGVPAGFEKLGVVERIFPNKSVVGVRISETNVHLNDTILFELDARCVQDNVQSLQVNNTSVDKATDGDPAGIKISYDASQIPKDTNVYVK